MEVARYPFKLKDSDKKQITAETLASLSEMTVTPFSVNAFGDWLLSLEKTFNYNILNLFYWEQRMGSWLATGCLGFSIAWQEVFFPFNCRNLLIDMLSVSEHLREEPNHKFFQMLIYHLWPDVLSEPINPPMKVNLYNKVLRKIKGKLIQKRAT